MYVTKVYVSRTYSRNSAIIKNTYLDTYLCQLILDEISNTIYFNNNYILINMQKYIKTDYATILNIT